MPAQGNALGLDGRTTHFALATISAIAPIDLASMEPEMEGSHPQHRESLADPIRLVRMVNQINGDIAAIN